MTAECRPETNRTPVEDVVRALRAGAGPIVDAALASLVRTRSPHYDTDGEARARERLERLLAVTIEAVDARRLTPMLDRVEEIAGERFGAAYDLEEIQVAFSVLEEAVWQRLGAVLAPEAVAPALGYVTTVLGGGKDAIARRYVDLTRRGTARVIETTRLSDGTQDTFDDDIAS